MSRSGLRPGRSSPARLVPRINTNYWMLTALTTQIIVMMYMLVFAAAIRLRCTQAHTPRPYAIPGGKAGILDHRRSGSDRLRLWLLIGFIPPTGVKHWATPVYRQPGWRAVYRDRAVAVHPGTQHVQ